jgi:hypothetical protein
MSEADDEIAAAVAVTHDAVKLCKDCRWCRVEGPWQLPGGPLPARHWCDQPQLLLPARPGYGADWDATPLARPCALARADDHTGCGAEGRYWVARKL